MNKAKEIDMNVPKLVIDILFNQTRAELGEYQYRDLMHLGNYFAYYMRGLKVFIVGVNRSVLPDSCLVSQIQA